MSKGGERMFTKESPYITTSLEDWVTRFYTRLRILHPSQIDIKRIAYIYDIYMHLKPMPSSYRVMGRYRGITIDCRKSKELQREIFFHELCHILRHAGVQSMMRKEFRDLQEWDANHFTLYAAIPHHMLRFLDFRQPTPLLIKEMSTMFKVTELLCQKRLEQIHNRIMQEKSYMLIGEHPTDYDF
jgi:Zn-dependent peptidase ImmA (M78 family)